MQRRFLVRFEFSCGYRFSSASPCPLCLGGDIFCTGQSQFGIFIPSVDPGNALGFGRSYEQANAAGKRSWAEVVAADITRSEERIRRIDRIEPRYVERVRAVLTDYETYLQSVRPVPFLDDTTTKNVIVNQGTLSGIVDTDEVCFGDPLFTLGLTNMALRSLGVDTDYVGYWLDAIGASRQQRAIVAVYSLVFCLGFMSELGQVFSQHVEYSEIRAQSLRVIFEHLMKSLTEAA